MNGKWVKWLSVVMAVAVIAFVVVQWRSQPDDGNRSWPVVLAAASLQQALEEAADVWAAQGHARPVLSFAATSALARQIEAGAPADLFFSADEDWMDYVARKNLIAQGARRDVLGNRLVLIAPRGGEQPQMLTPELKLSAMLGDGRLAIADPDTVPAGKYAKAALMSLGLWDGVTDRLAPAENVRAAMALVERGQAPFGIVYATDAQASSKIYVIGIFPPDSHPPIRYPLARLAQSSSPDAEAFRRYLMSDEAQAIFAQYGFERP
ncbi:MAG: molybdate ABC transporter substrate-binding protein [Sphingobium sp.]